MDGYRFGCRRYRGLRALGVRPVTHTYDAVFMKYTSNSSRYAAGVIARLLAIALQPTSVLDVGCAAGAWLAEWRRAGIADIFGVDGDYVDRSRLLIDVERFSSVDLSQPFRLNRKFDLVQCLEVAEHLAEASARRLIDVITDHAERYVLFSAAPPGQGGEHHVNERSYDYWRDLLSSRGFEALDYVRPAIMHDRRVSFWYRYNVLLYVRQSNLALLPPDVAATRIPPQAKVADLSPRLFQLRKLIVRSLPAALQNQIAVVKARVFPTGRF
jgi:SAM-dependent methyltransferase